MRQRKLFLHVGPRKTGTTAVQSFLRNHDNSVVIYPKVGLFGDGSHHNLVYSFFGIERGNRALSAKKSIGELLSKIAKECGSSDKDIVISSEVLDPQDYDVGAFVRGLLPHVGGDVDVEIVVALREHFARAASLYNQRVRASERRNRRLPDRFLKARAAEICYAPLVTGLKGTGFKVTALDYQPASTWTERFLAHIGFRDIDLPKTIERQRVGLSQKALVATIAANSVVRSKRKRDRLLDTFADQLNSGSSPGFIFGREAAADAERLFAEDRKFLLEECNIRLEPPDFESPEAMLVIDDQEFADIVEIASPLGVTGEQIIAFARRYVRHEAQLADDAGDHAG